MSAVGSEERATILSDFARGRAFLQFVLKVKLSHWETLPHVLCSASHHDEDMARHGLQKAVNLYRVRDPSEHHGLSNMALGADSELRQEILDFTSGRKRRKDLPMLTEFAAQLRFISVVERRCESLHARVQRFVVKAPHHSPMHIAFSMVWRELRQRMLDPNDAGFAWCLDLL